MAELPGSVRQILPVLLLEWRDEWKGELMRDLRRLRSIGVLAIAVAFLSACEGGSNLPSPTRSVSLPPLPSRTPVVSRTASIPASTKTSTPTPSPTSASTRTPTPTSASPKASTASDPTETSTQATTPLPTSPTSVPASATLGSTATASPVPAATSSTPLWPWILLILVVLAVISAFVFRQRSKRAAGG